MEQLADGAAAAAAVTAAGTRVGIVNSANPLLSDKSCRKLKTSLSTCYLAFGSASLRRAAIAGAARTQLKFRNDDARHGAETAAAAGKPQPTSRSRQSAVRSTAAAAAARVAVRLPREHRRRSSKGAWHDSDDGETTGRETKRAGHSRHDGHEQLHKKPRREHRPTAPRPLPHPSPAGRLSLSASSSDEAAAVKSEDWTPLEAVKARGDVEPQPPPSSSSKSVVECPVYRPTQQQWADPIAFIKSILVEASAWGMCRLVPPAGWNPPFAFESSRFHFSTRLQNVHQLQSAVPFVEGSKRYSLRQFQTLAETFKQMFFAQAAHQQPAQLSGAQVEAAYWDVVCGRSSSSSSYSAVQVEYGADLDSSVHGSGFESLQLRGDTLVNVASLYAGSVGWNLRALPLLRGSLLGLLPEHVPGVSTPWLYVGMLFSSFCWHTEDCYLLSMNYLHCGSSKSWYAAPGSQALQVEQAMRREHPDVFAAQPDAHHALTLQMSPHTLAQRYGVNVCHTVQSAGEFVCTFPAAYHAGFSHGFNVGEAVNFAIAAWLPFGRQAQRIDRQQAHPQCFSLQQLICTLVERRLQQHGEQPGHDQDDEDDDAILLQELEQLIADEARDRTGCVTAGVGRFVPMDAAAAAAVPQCAVCAVLCFLSLVHCERCRLPVTCLQHVAFACSCGNSDGLRVAYRTSLQQLSALQHRLKSALSAQQPHGASHSYSQHRHERSSPQQTAPHS